MLATGTRVRLVTSQVDAEVRGLLGEGAQGSVFLATVGTGRGSEPRDLALKWYLPHVATRAQWQALTYLVGRGAPSERFLWPLDLARSPDLPGFGYLMPLHGPGFVGLADLMTKRVDTTFRALTTLGIELAHSFLLLHNDGLCYRDLSFGNTFFDPVTGAVLVCDTDNVGIDGGPTTIKGTPYFMAPEVLRGEAAPSASTDLFSLAVLLFYVFLVHHPLEGSQALHYDCWDPAALHQLFGVDPVFVFDPDDDSNRPVAGLHDNVLASWPVLPEQLRALFVRSFTEGLRDPVNGRVRESEWRQSMAAARDLVVYCSKCGKQSFFEERGTTCWSCRASIAAPVVIQFGRTSVVLNHDTKLYAHHVRRDYDLETIVATVEQHPSEPNRWGLRNASTGVWTATRDGVEQMIRPGRAVTLRDALRVDFGGREGVVHAT